MSTDDQYWAKVGVQNPYWGVLTHEKYLGAELAPEAKEEFMKSGTDDIASVVAMIKSHVKPDFAPRNALDFGCGVGRLLLAMAPLAAGVTGYDISPGMLARASAHARERGLSNVRLLADIPNELFDWINSYIVFQHIEPRRGMAALLTLLSRLPSGGVISLHFAIYRDERVLQGVLHDVAAGRYDGENFAVYSRRGNDQMPIYEYDLGEVVCHMTRHGIHTLVLRHTDHAGLHGVWVFGAKD
jgi:SAM-dependent methyltransferase